MKKKVYVMQAKYNNRGPWVDLLATRCDTRKEIDKAKRYYKKSVNLDADYRAVKRETKETILK